MNPQSDGCYLSSTSINKPEEEQVNMAACARTYGLLPVLSFIVFSQFNVSSSMPYNDKIWIQMYRISMNDLNLPQNVYVQLQLCIVN